MPTLVEMERRGATMRDREAAMLARYAPANAMLSDNGPAVLDLMPRGPSARPKQWRSKRVL